MDEHIFCICQVISKTRADLISLNRMGIGQPQALADFNLTWYLALTPIKMTMNLGSGFFLPTMDRNDRIHERICGIIISRYISMPFTL